MADSSVGGLYMRLGLSLDELETDFIAAEKTTRENLARLNRESNLIKLRAEVEIGNLDSVADAAQILAVKENALNEQLKIQSDRVKLAEATYNDLNQRHGESATVTQRAAAALERERLSLQQLEKELQNVKKAQTEVNQNQSDTKPPTPTNKFLDIYQGLKGEASSSIGKLATAFNDLKSASGSADAAITKSLEIIGSIPHPAGKAVAALAAIPLVMHGIENSLIDLAKPAIAAGDSFYVMSRGMQMSIKDTAQLSMICKVTGIEISEVNSAMRRFSTQLSKGNSDSAMLKMLKKYGAEVRDSSGKIKNEIELAGELGKALKRAQAEGNGAAFRDVVGGKFWSGDFVTFLEDFADNVEQAKKVVKNGLADPKRAHAIQGELNTLEAQAGQLKSAFSSAFMPIAEKIVPNTTERLGALTKVIADNADGIKSLADYIGTFVDKIGGAANSGVITLIELAGGLGEFLKSSNKTVEKYINDKEVNSVEDLVKKELQENYSPLEKLRIEKDPLLYQQTLEFYEPIYKAIADARGKVEEEGKKVGEAVQESTYESFHALKGYHFENPDDIRKEFEETKKLSDELYKLTHTDYQNRILEAQRWQEKLLQSEETTAEQRVLAEKITSEKIAQIEKERNDKIQNSLKAAADIEYGLTHTAFEKQIYDIERWQEKSLEALDKYKDALQAKGEYDKEAAAIAAEARAKESEAFIREMDRIQGKIESAQDKLFRLTHSQKDYDLYQAQKEYRQNIKDGLPEGLAKQLYDATVADIQRRAKEDKGGSYTKSKNGGSGNSQFIGGAQFLDFTTPKAIDWTKVNAGDLAYDSLRQKNQQLADSMQEIATAHNNLTKATIQNTNAQGITYIEGDQIVTAFNNSTQGVIEAQNNLAQSMNQAAQGFEYIEGDRIVTSFANSAQGVIDAENALVGATNQAAKNFQYTPPKLPDNSAMINAQNQLAEKIVGMNQSIETISRGIDSFSSVIDAVVRNSESVSTALKNTAIAIEETGKKMAFSEFKFPQREQVNSALNIPMNYSPSDLNLVPLITETQAIRAGIDNLNVIASSLKDFNALNEQPTFAQTPTDFNLEPLIIEVQAIRAGVDKIQPQQPSITVSPNINIDLGGAYVFDDAMKKQLTNDVTNEVVASVKDAFQQAKNQASYSYAN